MKHRERQEQMQAGTVSSMTSRNSGWMTSRSGTAPCPSASLKSAIARRLQQEAADIGREGADDLDPERRGSRAPKHDLALGKHRPRAHARAKCRRVKIERATRIQVRRLPRRHSVRSRIGDARRRPVHVPGPASPAPIPWRRDRTDGARINHSSGPSHSALRSPAVTARQGCTGSAKPSGVVAASTAAARPRRISRVQGGRSVRCSAASAMQPRPPRIIKHRRNNPHADRAIRHRREQMLVHPRPPVLQQRQRDRTAERCAAGTTR